MSQSQSKSRMFRHLSPAASIRRLLVEQLEPRRLLALDLELLKDINAMPDLAGSEPSEVIEVGALTFFVATTPLHGHELWRTDGTPAGTVLVKDIGRREQSSFPLSLTNVNGTLYFTAENRAAGSAPTDSNGRELWKSDGTAAGTVLVKDIHPGVEDSDPRDLTNVNGSLYFVTNDGTNGLWRSDGTEAGTTLVRNFAQRPDWLTAVGNVLYFAANDGTSGTELWRTEGLPANTTLVKDLRPGATSYDGVSYLTNVAGTLYFSGNDGINGAELWKSNGTSIGTTLVKNIAPGVTSSGPRETIGVGSKVFFFAHDGTRGFELWTSDGTTLGTVMVKDINPGGADSIQVAINTVDTKIVSIGSTIFFQANDGSSGTELWRSDGTAPGTNMVKDILPGSTGADPDDLSVVGGLLYFAADDGINGRELWKSDGTNLGTIGVKDIQLGAPSGSPDHLKNVGGTLFFSADNGVTGRELWTSNGTANTTQLVKDLRAGTIGSEAGHFENVSGTLYFVAEDGSTGEELWKTDGTAAGTVLVKDIRFGLGSSSPYHLTNVGGVLYFTANDGSGVELWKSNGTAVGTIMVKNLTTGTGDTTISELTAVGNTLYFVAGPDGINSELWRSDGTATGTVMVREIRPGSLGSNPLSLEELDGLLFFSANDGVNGYELWMSDGTNFGTAGVKDIRVGAEGGSPFSITNLGGTLYFGAQSTGSDFELWKSDGTPNGTVMLREGFDIFPFQYSPSTLIKVGSTVFFSANDAVNGSELWKTDGTPGGTALVKNIRPSDASSVPYDFADVGGTLYFTANDGASGYEVWKSNGTAAGTVLVKDILPGPSGLGPYHLTNVKGTLYFTTNDGLNGYELWQSNGTAAGTILADDITGDLASSDPNFLTVVGDRLFVVARDAAHGDEIWAALALTEAVAPGDFDRDFHVTGADFLTWQRQLGQNVAPLDGADGDGNGRVEAADFLIWRNNFGNVYTGAPGEILVIEGAGFDQNADTVVVFTDQLGNAVSVPALSVTATMVEVSLPIFIDFDSFEPSSGVVSVEVHQTVPGSTIVTPVYDAFRVENLPETELPPGTLTLELLDVLGALANLAITDYQRIGAASLGEVDVSDLIANLGAMREQLRLLSAALAPLVAGTVDEIEFGQLADAPLTLSTGGLAVIDRGIAAYILRRPDAAPSPLAAQSPGDVSTTLADVVGTKGQFEPMKARQTIDNIIAFGNAAIGSATLIAAKYSSIPLPKVLKAGEAIAAAFTAASLENGATFLAGVAAFASEATRGQAAREALTFIAEGLSDLALGKLTVVLAGLFTGTAEAAAIVVTGVEIALAGNALLENHRESIGNAIQGIVEHLQPPAPTINIEGEPLTTNESGGTDSFTVTLTREPAAPVQIIFDSDRTDEAVVVTSMAIFPRETWWAPRTVTVQGVDDEATDGAQSFTIRSLPATSSDPVYAGRNFQDVAGENLDDDLVARDDADLAVVDIIDNPDPGFEGQTTVYSITVRNNGPDAAQQVTIRFGGVHLIQSVSGLRGTISLDPNGHNGQSVFASMVSGESFTFQVVMLLTEFVGVPVFETRIESLSNDEAPSNNRQSEQTTVLFPRSANFDLALSLSSPDPTFENSRSRGLSPQTESGLIASALVRSQMLPPGLPLSPRTLSLLGPARYHAPQIGFNDRLTNPPLLTTARAAQLEWAQETWLGLCTLDDAWRSTWIIGSRSTPSDYYFSELGSRGH